MGCILFYCVCYGKMMAKHWHAILWSIFGGPHPQPAQVTNRPRPLACRWPLSYWDGAPSDPPTTRVFPGSWSLDKNKFLLQFWCLTVKPGLLLFPSLLVSSTLTSYTHWGLLPSLLASIHLAATGPTSCPMAHRMRCSPAMDQYLGPLVHSDPWKTMTCHDLSIWQHPKLTLHLRILRGCLKPSQTQAPLFSPPNYPKRHVDKRSQSSE